MARYGEAVADGIKRERPFLIHANAQRGVTSTIDLSVAGDTPDAAVTLLNEITTDVKVEHSRMYEQNLGFVTERLAHMALQRIAMQRQYDEIASLLEELKLRDPVQASLIMLEQGRIAAAINALDAERPNLQRRLTTPLTRNTDLLSEIVAPGAPASPRKALILALSLMLGLMGGVVLAFIAQFITNAQQGNISRA